MSIEDPIVQNREEVDQLMIVEIERKATEFQSFGKISRLSRDCVITEKIDGTNGQILITEKKQIFVGSRSRWLVENGMLVGDHFGFGAWVLAHKDELIEGLGIGRHFGEWWGYGIQRKYGLTEKRFSLFNVSIWNEQTKPACCYVVPKLYEGVFETESINVALERLRKVGSVAAPGFLKPEGIIIYHTAAGMYFKKTLENDESPKGKVDVN